MPCLKAVGFEALVTAQTKLMSEPRTCFGLALDAPRSLLAAAVQYSTKQCPRCAPHPKDGLRSHTEVPRAIRMCAVSVVPQTRPLVEAAAPATEGGVGRRRGRPILGVRAP
jgi:hypothetical protein